MKIIKSIIIILIVSLLSADYAGGYSGSALRLGVSARDISLSGSMVSAYNQGFSSFSNPALISKTDGIVIGSSLFLLTNNINMQVFSIARDLPPNAGASLSVVHIGVSDIIGIDQNEQLTESLSFHDSHIMMSFGINLDNFTKLSKEVFRVARFLLLIPIISISIERAFRNSLSSKISTITLSPNNFANLYN